MKSKAQKIVDEYVALLKIQDTQRKEGAYAEDKRRLEGRIQELIDTTWAEWECFPLSLILRGIAEFPSAEEIRTQKAWYLGVIA